MARSTRMSRGAPAAASTATATAASRIDGFGRVSKRVAPSSGKKSAVTATDSTAASTARLDAIARRFVEKKQEEDDAIKVDVVAELPSTERATPTKKTKTRKTKKAATPAAATSATTTTTTTTPCAQRKRRAAEAVDVDPCSSSPTAAQPTPAKRARKIKQATTKTSVAALLARAAEKKSAAASASASSLQTATPADSDSDTPSQTAGDLIAQLNINTAFASSYARLRSTSTSPRPASTAPTTPCESDSESEPQKTLKTFAYTATAPLPYELSELVRLHNAFSKALAVHHAHHGPSAPIDIRAFCPTVAQSWGKRKVTLEDIQRCLGVAMSGETAGSDSIVNALFLSDYTRGKICIELKPDVFSNAAALGTLADQLNAAFESNLCALWAKAPHANANANATPSSAEVRHFIERLPKAKATKSNSLLQTSALRAKGQRTLEELMHSIALKKQEREAQEALLKAPIPASVQESQADAMDVDPTAPAAAAPTAAPAAPMNLLDRIRYRQMQRTQLAAAGQLTAATPEELERRAALSRAGDIAEVMSMLCTAASLRQSNRVSFGMAAIISKIKDSLVRLPIAREEAASCVRLLAKEVSPEWLQIVSMGGREIVIMMADRVPSKSDIQQRVQRLS